MTGFFNKKRFLFIHTLGRPDLARRLVRLAHTRDLPVLLSRNKVTRLLNATMCLKHQAAHAGHPSLARSTIVTVCARALQPRHPADKWPARVDPLPIR